MSAYSDLKCGAITDEEYKYYNRRECGDGDIEVDYETEGSEEEHETDN
jgi:hypothetical protein